MSGTVYSILRGAQAADIGVGVMGKEGRQAVNNSDFAIGQFRCGDALSRLTCAAAPPEHRSLCHPKRHCNAMRSTMTLLCGNAQVPDATASDAWCVLGRSCCFPRILVLHRQSHARMI